MKIYNKADTAVTADPYAAFYPSHPLHMSPSDLQAPDANIQILGTCFY